MAEGLVGPDGYPIDALRENWHSVNELAYNLAGQIEGHCQSTGEQFDAIVVIPRGSYQVANIVSRRLGFEAPDLIHMCMTTRKDGDIGIQNRFRYGQMPLPQEVEGLNLLALEEVCDTGVTLSHSYELLKAAKVGKVMSAVLHYKPAMSTTGFVPDWYGGQTDAWIVYPWEKDERMGHESIAKRDFNPAQQSELPEIVKLWQQSQLAA